MFSAEGERQIFPKQTNSKRVVIAVSLNGNEMLQRLVDDSTNHATDLVVTGRNRRRFLQSDLAQEPEKTLSLDWED